MIGGIERCSWIDYPGRLSAVVFLRGCNLRCPYCHNPALLSRSGAIAVSEGELLTFLAARRGRLDGVVFSGGEPTLDPRLRRLIEATRRAGFGVKLDTNGTRPDVLATLLGDGLLDYVALDLKDEPTAYAEWLGVNAAPEALVRSLELVKISGIDHELRTTVVESRHDLARLDRMARWAAGSRRWLLQRCRPRAAPPSPLPGPAGTAALEATASRLRERHRVACYCR